MVYHHHHQHVCRGLYVGITCLVIALSRPGTRDRISDVGFVQVCLRNEETVRTQLGVGAYRLSMED